jgi:hypothetical protein
VSSEQKFWHSSDELVVSFSSFRNNTGSRSSIFTTGSYFKWGGKSRSVLKHGLLE